MSSTTLRTSLIRLAHSNPEMREHLLPLLKQADELDTETSLSDIVHEFGGWNRILQRPKIQAPDPDVATDYTAITTLMKRLVAGDMVSVAYNDPMRGGEVKTVRIISHSWADLKTLHPGHFTKPTVLLQPKVAGQFKGGTLSDYGYGSVMFQGTMKMQVTPVSHLRKLRSA